jgi:PqqD family protein of HPr-rel-A system
VWRLTPTTALKWRRWDDEWVVYNEASGDTIQLDPFAAVTLMCLEAEPFELSSLVDQVAAELDVAAGEALSARLESVLGDLALVGLIEPIET